MLKRNLDRIYSAIQNIFDKACAPLPTGSQSRASTWMLLIPNSFSLARIPLGIAVWIRASEHSIGSVLSLIALAMLSDMLDGYLARRLHSCTLFGVILDPWCDKVFFLCCALGCRAAFAPWIFWPLLFIEASILVSPLLGAVWSSTGRKVEYSSNIYGKSKFTAECLALL
ncbi:MAG: CDP-alcohol phosphatidyltransferase family protein, partial [Patescibacteria group bacterium]|nr:CDP-alcohol phosphatidyltransferase family protein [Patescibacteria group bacterium]